MRSAKIRWLDRPSPYTVGIGIPGPNVSFRVWVAAMGGTVKHNFMLTNSSLTAEGNFNQLWAEALDAAEAGEITHFAMLHADTFPLAPAEWIDADIEEMDKHGLELISSAIAIKNEERIMSCGLSNPANTWFVERWVKLDELSKLPPTFTAADLGQPGAPLLHNNGCWVADLRCKKFHAENEAGELICDFRFPRRIVRDKKAGLRVCQRESEDFYFSRMIHQCGIKSAITQRVKILHAGHPNWLDPKAPQIPFVGGVR